MNSNSDKDSDIVLDKKHIQKYIFRKLLQLNKYHYELIDLLERKYTDKDFKSEDYFKEYYCINSEWIKNYLEFYNYDKIKRIYERIVKNKENISLEDFYQMINEKRIYTQPGKNDERINKLRSINLKVKKEDIPSNIYRDYYNESIIEYFDDFALLDKELYDEIKQDYKNPINPYYDYYHIDENIVHICLVDYIFIYKINENILGIGIPNDPSKKFPLFKIQFFVIMEKDKDTNYNSETEIKQLFSSKSLEKYLINDRNVKFEDIDKFKKISMMDKTKTIGIIYNINDFSIENYKGRSERIIMDEMKNEIFKKERQTNIREMLDVKKEKEDKLFKKTLEKKYIRENEKERKEKEKRNSIIEEYEKSEHFQKSEMNEENKDEEKKDKENEENKNNKDEDKKVNENKENKNNNEVKKSEDKKDKEYKVKEDEDNNGIVMNTKKIVVKRKKKVMKIVVTVMTIVMMKIIVMIIIIMIMLMIIMKNITNL